ncbi:MAG: GIY-YIG nuclease family protein [Coprococcus sp.]|nr:GIY-YIG nuclease family protein [Coprococcus sp.]
MNYTYILQCSDGTFYTGWTTDITRRLKTHNAGRGAKYTKTRRPVELVYLEEYETRADAMKREIQIKKMNRKRKMALIEKKKAGESSQ